MPRGYAGPNTGADKARPATAAPGKPRAATPAAPSRGTGDTWQRLALNQPSESASASSWADHAIASPGVPLDDKRRSYFERRYGADLSAVRVHEGAAATDAARALEARAFTMGSDIVLGAREDGGHSDAVMAHELAHVVQRSPPAGTVARMPLALGDVGDPAERAARTAADAAMHPGLSPVPIARGDSGATIRRDDLKGGKKGAPKKKAAPQDDRTPFYIELESAADLAKRGMVFGNAVQADAKTKSPFVLVIVTDALYIYSSTGVLKDTFRLTAPPPILGLYIGGGRGTLQAMVDKQGDMSFREIGGWDAKHRVKIDEWTTMTAADQVKYFGGDIVPIFFVPGDPANKSTHATAQPTMPDQAPDPNAVASSKASAGKGDKAKGELKRPPSGDEFEGGTNAKAANYPAFPAEMRSSAGLVPQLGSSELTMHLDWTYGESELIGAVWNASVAVKYHWERWDISAAAGLGKVAKEERAKQDKQAPIDKKATVTDQYSEHDAKQRARDIAEDVENSAKTIGSGGTKGDPLSKRYHDVTTEVGNLAMAPVSVIKSAGGHLIDSATHIITKPDNEITLEWNTPGHFLIRCVATPHEHQGRRYLSSVATTFVEVRDAEYIATNTLGAGDALMEELRLKQAISTDLKEIEKLDDQLAEIEIGTHGSAVAALELAVKKKQGEVDRAIGRAKSRRQDELDALNKQLEIAKKNEEKIIAGPDGKKLEHALRPEAAIASEVTGATYPLLLQLMQLSYGSRPRWAIYDVTGKGDYLGHAYVGEGDNDAAAIERAFKEFAGANDYGRGTVVLHIPDSVPNVSQRELVRRNVRVGDALAKDRLHDLIIVLTALSLVIPGVGEAAMLLGGVMAAAHIIERWKNGTLEADASLVSDIIGVLGALGSVAGRVGGMMIVKAEGAYAVALESGDAVAIETALKGVDRAAMIARGVQIGNEIVAYGGLMWGQMETLKEIEKINADEDEGRITHSAARTARAHALLGAVQAHVLMFTGPLHEQGGGSKAREEPARKSGGGEEPARSNEPVKTGQLTIEPVAVGGGSGAVKGKESWPLRSGAKEKPLEASDRAVKDGIIKGAADRKKAGEAEIRGGATVGHYVLDVAGTGGNKAEAVAVRVEIVGAFDPASAPHGGDEGPVRLELVRSGGKWEAVISIHEMVGKGDVSKIATHEIDEIVEIIRGTEPAMTDEAASTRAKEQMQAELFRPGEPSGKAATAHDTAAARELGKAYTDLARAKTPAAKEVVRTRIAAMKKSMGLTDAAGGPERVQALENMEVIPHDEMVKIREEVEAEAAAKEEPQDPANAKTTGDDATAAKPDSTIDPDDPQRGVKEILQRLAERIPKEIADGNAIQKKINEQKAKIFGLKKKLLETKSSEPGRADMLKELKSAAKKLEELEGQKEKQDHTTNTAIALQARLQKALDAKTYDRPKFRKDMRREVWDLARKEGGGKVLSPSRTEIPNFTDPWVIGHKPKYEFWKHQESAAKRGISREEFIAEYNRDASHYRPETQPDNSSHKYEDRTSAYEGPGS